MLQNKLCKLDRQHLILAMPCETNAECGCPWLVFAEAIVTPRWVNMLQNKLWWVVSDTIEIGTLDFCVRLEKIPHAATRM